MSVVAATSPAPGRIFGGAAPDHLGGHYLFGEAWRALLVHPITHALDAATNTTEVATDLPCSRTFHGLPLTFH